jgi:hypothetical protein
MQARSVAILAAQGLFPVPPVRNMGCSVAASFPSYLLVL